MSAKQNNKQSAVKFAAISFTPEGWEDYLFWQENDAKILARINTLLDECLKTPFTGLGKPEPLRGDLTGYWSRRIDKEHRLVYLPQAGQLIVLQCRYHY